MRSGWDEKEADMQDLFHNPTQQEIVYNFIKQKGRRFTHELAQLSINNNINDPYTRARELARAGKIGRMKEDLRKRYYPLSKEEVWTIYKEEWVQKDEKHPIRWTNLPVTQMERK